LIISANEPGKGQDKYRIDREEVEKFHMFLRAVPTPYLWERTRQGRINMYAWLIIGGVLFAGWVVALIALELVKAL
jgi:hypothetical protein